MLFVNHDLAGYEVPVHADVPHLDVVFVDEVDPTMSPLKANVVGELGLSGVAPAIANAGYNATGVRVRAPTRSPWTSTWTGCRRWPDAASHWEAWGAGRRPGRGHCKQSAL